MPVQHTDSAKVTAVRVTEQPTYGRTVTGYGSKIPTRYMLTYDGRNRRVYAMSYGNSSSLYVIANGEDLFLDSDTEYKLQAL